MARFWFTDGWHRVRLVAVEAEDEDAAWDKLDDSRHWLHEEIAEDFEPDDWARTTERKFREDYGEGEVLTHTEEAPE